MALPAHDPQAAAFRHDSPPRVGAGRAPDTVESLEIALLLEAVYAVEGHDFRGYARPGLRRRIRRRVQEESAGTVSGLQARVLHDPAAMRRLVLGLSVTSTSMFRDPPFFRQLREKVVPVLRTYPLLRVWHVGCSTGEEVYSMAILLEEEGLYERTRLYATDMQETLLERAERGVFELEAVQRWEAAYRASGGRGSLGGYYKAVDGRAVLDLRLRRNVVFAQHNLATDASFNEFHLILCRHVLIYFGPGLQHRAHRMLYDSLVRFGFLGLGRRESTRLSPHERRYQAVDGATALYRKVA